MNYITCSDLNNLDETNFIAGTTYTLKFVVLDQDGNAIDLSDADCSWNLAPYGTDYTILTKTGNVITTNSFEIVLAPDDTRTLSDAKYVQQPSIVFSNGVEVIPGQGIISVTKRIR